MKLIGSVMRNGQAVARGVTVTLSIRGSHWSGELSLPKGATILSGGYQLQLNDRRTGRITIGKVDGNTAFFEGEGELKRL
jgi:hypothetical protein